MKILSRIVSVNWKSFFFTSFVILFLDQISKLIILSNFSPGESVEVIPGFFNLVLTFNQGAAFGMMAGLQDGVRQLVLMLTTMIALAVVFYFLLYEYKEDRVGQLALALIFGGALGNIADRLRLGMVVDFLDFYFQNYHWPAFNLADSAICIAVCILLFHRPKRQKEATAADGQF